MTRITGRPTLWEALNKGHTGKAMHWAGLTLVCVLIGFSWALALLSYLLPPIPLYTDLVTGQIGLYPAIFLAVATAAFTFDFLFARHLFCKYGCAVGLVQSIAWMTNGRGRVVTLTPSGPPPAGIAPRPATKPAPCACPSAATSGQNSAVPSACSASAPAARCRKTTLKAPC